MDQSDCSKPNRGECQICLFQGVQLKRLPCGHSYCYNCIAAFRPKKCPLDRTDFHVNFTCMTTSDYKTRANMAIFGTFILFFTVIICIVFANTYWQQQEIIKGLAQQLEVENRKSYQFFKSKQIQIQDLEKKLAIKNERLVNCEWQLNTTRQYISLIAHQQTNKTNSSNYTPQYQRKKWYLEERLLPEQVWWTIFIAFVCGVFGFFKYRI